MFELKEADFLSGVYFMCVEANVWNTIYNKNYAPEVLLQV